MDFLSHLTQSDRDRLLEAADRRVFQAEAAILREGEVRNAIFVIFSGQARVERNHMEVDVEIARLNAGEVFGEMGFIEGFEASASVIADVPCEVGMIDAGHVQALIEEDPGFYGRFYQSLAHVLSRRLRETTDTGIAEFAWGGQGFGSVAGDDAFIADLEWGGGSPLRDEST